MPLLDRNKIIAPRLLPGRTVSSGAAPGSAVPPPPTQVFRSYTAPLEAINGQQLTAQLGFGHEAIWRHIWNCNETTNPLYGQVGSTMDSLVGTPTFNVAGPLDAYDKGVQFTDAQAAQIGTANGAVNPLDKHWAILCEVRFTALPAANRIVLGVDAGEDLFLQYMSASGNVRVVTTDGGVGTQTANIAQNHNTANWHTILATGVVGSNIRCASELGDSGNQTSTYVSLDTSAAGWALGRNGSSAPCVISFCAVAISDGTALQNNAIIAIRDNINTAISNYRTATGR